MIVPAEAELAQKKPIAQMIEGRMVRPYHHSVLTSMKNK
jgi:hypothetical protein